MQRAAEKYPQSRLLQNVDPHLRHARAMQPHRTRCPEGKIDNPSANEGTTVIDPNDNGFAALHIHHPYLCSKRKRSVRCRKRLRVELFSTRGFPPVLVIRCHADLTRHRVDSHER